MIYTFVAIFSNDKILQSIKLTFIIVLIRLRYWAVSSFIKRERFTCCSVSIQLNMVLYIQYHFAYNAEIDCKEKSGIVKLC